VQKKRKARFVVVGENIMWSPWRVGQGVITGGGKKEKKKEDLSTQGNGGEEAILSIDAPAHTPKEEGLERVLLL